MSHPVRSEHLATAFEGYAEGYLLTVAPGEAPSVRAVAVRPRVADGPDGPEVVVGAGRSSSANVTANPQVTVLCPPTEPAGFTLLVDGTATVDGEVIRVRPRSAVLHRPPHHADGPPPPDFARDEGEC